MQSTFFPDAHDFSVFDSSFNHIQGDQYNYTNPPIPGSSSSVPGAVVAERTTSMTTMVNNFNGNQINRIVERRKKKPTEFDDFRVLKRGDICRYQDVVQFSPNQQWWCDPDCQCEFCQHEKVIKTVCIGKVEGTRGKFTVMTYSGPGGRKAFERDFQQYSSVVTSRVLQMYAVDIGSIPSILYWNELVPAVVLKGNVGLLGQMYLSSLCQQWNCAEGELWMDPTRGVICCGPEGPDPNLPYSALEVEDMPSTVDLLQDNVCLRFMASCQSKKVDHTFLDGIISTKSDVGMLELFDQPTIISALTQTPIAIGNHVWDDEYNNFVEKKVLESGLTRFRVVGHGLFVLWWNGDTKNAWLCQALGVFHAQGIGLDDNLSVLRLVSHEAWLQGDLSYNQFHCQQRSQQPIYLFLHPPPPNPNQCWGETSSLHFWSFHEDGQKPLPPEICNDLGLPTTLEYKDWGYESMSWSTKLYKQLDEYQRLRGFDPTTTNFARHLGYARNIFKPVHNTDRFHKDYKDQHIECLRSPDLNYGCSNGDNDVNYPAIQKKHNVEKCSHTLSNLVVIPTPTHIIANGRTNAEEGRMDCCYYMDQNRQSTNNIFDVHTVAEPCLQHIPLDSRRYASNYSPAHTGYPTTTSSLPNCTASAHPYKSHWNSILPSHTEVLPTTNESFTAGYSSNPLPMEGLPDIFQTAGHDYRLIPFDAADGFYDGAPMFHNHNTGHRTDTGVPDMARGFDAPSQGELDELCIRFERLAIV
ncbi:hypothetical protein PQX77_011557 [Marasmius sp. AFHP31]|nr:hypothetical protein PQX77_011557 [Marasmius sp. AFHP31]